MALPVFVAVYLMSWGAYRWQMALAYAAVMALLIWAFYGELMGLLMHESFLFG